MSSLRRVASGWLATTPVWNLGSYLFGIVSFSLILFSIVLVALNFSDLPSRIPFFLSAIWGPKRLAPREFLWAVPALIILLAVINGEVVRRLYRTGERITAALTLAVGLAIDALLTGAVISILVRTTDFRIIAGLMSLWSRLQLWHLDRVIPAFAVGLLTALLATPLTIKFAKRLGIIDDPHRRHPAILHSKPVPRAGAVPVFLGLLVGSLAFLAPDKTLVGLLTAAGIAILIGVLDDRFDLNPYLRLGGQLLAALIIVAFGIGITFVNNPLGGVIRLDQIDIPLNIFGERHILLPADLITIVWIVFAANMISWSNGVDGQFSGVAGIAALAIGALSLRFVTYEPAQLVPAVVSFALAGAVLGTLPFTWHPARIFYGFGATAVGVTLAAISVLTGAKVATAILVLLVPLLDALAAIIRRIIRKQSPVWGDRAHLHHHLINRGWSHPKIAVLYWFLTAVCGTTALLTAGRSKALAILTVGGLVGLVLILVNLRPRPPFWKKRAGGSSRGPEEHK